MNRQAIQLFEVAYPTVARDAALSSPSSNKQLVLRSLSAYNSTGSAIDIGLGVRHSTSAWKLYQVNASYTDLTSSVQAGSAVSILPTTNNYGFIVQAKDIFGCLSLTISQAETGSPTYSYQYWNGSTWATLNLRNTPVYTATGSIAIAFAPPIDWAQGNGSVVSDLAWGAGYCIRVRGTTAPSTAVQITAFAVSHFVAFRNVGSKAALSLSFSERPLLLEIGEAVQAYFATAANANSVEGSYQVNG